VVVLLVIVIASTAVVLVWVVLALVALVLAALVLVAPMLALVSVDVVVVVLVALVVSVAIDMVAVLVTVVLDDLTLYVAAGGLNHICTCSSFTKSIMASRRSPSTTSDVLYGPSYHTATGDWPDGTEPVQERFSHVEPLVLKP
jgi:hypothetical protein